MQNKQALFQTIFNKDIADSSNTEYLTELTEAHPYFTPAQFYLLQRTEKDTEAFEQRANRTSFLFNNPYWLHFQLQDMTGGQSAPDESLSSLPEQEATPETIQNGTANETDLATETDEEDYAPTDTEIEPMKIELKMPAEPTALDESMLIEPMHVVDYFASQGIKLSDEIQAGDKLGKQLKSFTEWLKTMKKVHPGQEAEAATESGHPVQQMAETSNANTEVLTESMAEVFAKQGKMDKAAETYQKLSLLNPAKSAYFAAKIENLKEK